MYPSSHTVMDAKRGGILLRQIIIDLDSVHDARGQLKADENMWLQENRQKRLNVVGM